MTPNRYEQVKSAFREAVELPPEQRERFLRDIGVDDADLHTHLLLLLESDSAPYTPIDYPAVGQQFRARTRTLSYTAAPHSS